MHPLYFKFDPTAEGGGGTPAATPADAGASAAAPAAGSGDAVPVATPEAGAAVSPEPWNGDIEAVTKQPWWAQVPEEVRPHVETGLRTVRKGWQSAYDKHRVEKVAPLEKSISDLQAQLRSAQSQRSLFSDILAEDEKNGPLLKQIEGLTESLTKTTAERDDYKGKYDKYEAEKAESFYVDYMRGHETKYPDIYADLVFPEGDKPATGAYASFIKLLNEGEDEETAAAMVRVKLAKNKPAEVAAPAAAPVVPKQPREVVIPPGIQQMSQGGPRASAATRNPIESFDEVKRRITAQAQDEE